MGLCLLAAPLGMAGGQEAPTALADTAAADTLADAVIRRAPDWAPQKPGTVLRRDLPVPSQPEIARNAPTPERRPPPISLHTASHAGQIVVPIDMSQIVELDRRYSEVSIGNSEIADVVPLTTRSVYVFGKQLGTTSLTLAGSSGEIIALVDLVVSFDIEGLKRQLHELVPGQRIEVHPAAGGLVLSGQVASAGQLDRVLAIASRYASDRITNLIEVTGSQQVMLAVRFAEVQRAVIKQLGFTNAFSINDNDVISDVVTGDGPSFDPASFAIADLTAFLGDVTLEFLLDTLEEKGVIKTLAEPNLIALSGDSARFLAGGEFPIPVGTKQDDSGIDVTIEFKEFGVSLSFTPTVVANDLINLELFTEVSEIDVNTSIVVDGLVIPGLKVRRARTTVELGDGLSFAIAGLLQEDFEDAVRQFPILGDVPVLGTLFRSTAWQTGQTELVVIVTPYLVRPVRGEALLDPTELFAPPSEPELFLMGRTEGSRVPIHTSPAKSPLNLKDAGGIVGPYGYILR